MKSKWQTKKIGEVVDIRRGSSPRPIHKYLASEGMPWVKIADATSDTSRYIWRTNEFILDDGVNKSVKVIPETLIVSNSATPGLPKIMKITACVHDGWLVFSNYRGITRDFLYYKFIDIRRQLVNQANGSVFQNLKTDIVKDFDIDIPSIETQKKIVGILSNIDEKIELNNAINNNLLEQLNQLFIEFSTRCEWNYLSIGEIAEKVAMGPFGSNIKVSTFVELGVPIISGNHLRGYFLEEPSYNYITEAHADKLKNSIVYPKDIVFTHAGNIGQVAMIPDGCEYPYYVLSQRQFYLRCNTMIVAPEYVLLFFHSKQGQHELLSYANQTGVPSIAQPASNLKKICLPIPPISEQKKWLLVVEPIIAMYQNNYKETKRLSILRDTLLPKLMSGELDVSDIDI